MAIRLFPCPACRHPIAIDSKICPRCDHPIGFWEGATAWKHVIKNVDDCPPAEQAAESPLTTATPATLPCAACKRPFDRDSETCPHCGHSAMALEEVEIEVQETVPQTIPLAVALPLLGIALLGLLFLLSMAGD